MLIKSGQYMDQKTKLKYVIKHKIEISSNLYHIAPSMRSDSQNILATVFKGSPF